MQIDDILLLRMNRQYLFAPAKDEFTVLRGVAEHTAFAQRAEQPAPRIERALFFIGGHAVLAAEKAQLLAAAAAFLGGV